ncbi:MAG TPA: hydrogenase maturation peptidase HycI [Synergistaceae bacterium]|jgi:hydrogenase 3 maturation protease|nr:hydrogenase maturation peptidase HycI [Synergistaceae bacterium]
MERATIWCIGNPLMSDDGAGPALFRRLAGSLPAGIKAIDCETTPENWLAPLRKHPPRTLVVVDAAEMGTEPGAIRRIPLAMTEEVHFSAHGLPLSLLLHPFQDTVEIVVLGIQPKRRGLGTELSPEVRSAVETVADAITECLWENFLPYQENFSPR